MKQRIRPLTIAGSADVVNLFKEKTHGASVLLKKFKGAAFGSTYYESDIAVPVPSARFDSIYTVDRREDYIAGAVTDLSQTRQTNFAPLLILNTIHASPFPADVPDMVEVPARCIESVNCDHPTMKYILDHLAGKPVPQYGPGVVSESLGGFMTSFRINFPPCFDARKYPVKIQLVTPNPNNEIQIKIANDKEVMSAFNYLSPDYPNLLFRSETGHLIYKDYKSEEYRLARQNGVKATFLIQAAGFKPRYVQTILKPTYSTFIEVSLAPE